MKYISVDALQAFCDNQKNHSITPNDFQRMNQIEIISCDECKWWSEFTCQNDRISRQINDCGCYPDFETDGDFFCKHGERKEGDGE